MVEIVEVEDWGNIESMQGLFYIRVKKARDIQQIADQFELKFIFKKGTEMLCNNENIIYWYK